MRKEVTGRGKVKHWDKSSNTGGRWIVEAVDRRGYVPHGVESTECGAGVLNLTPTKVDVVRFLSIYLSRNQISERRELIY